MKKLFSIFILTGLFLSNQGFTNTTIKKTFTTQAYACYQNTFMALKEATRAIEINTREWCDQLGGELVYFPDYNKIKILIDTDGTIVPWGCGGDVLIEAEYQCLFH